MNGPRPNDVILCSQPGCPRAASYGPYCVEHRRGATPIPDGVQVIDLDDITIQRLRHQVERDAAPLFVLAMQHLATRQVQESLAALPFCSPAADGAVEGPTPPASIVAVDPLLCVPARTTAGEQNGSIQ